MGQRREQLEGASQVLTRWARPVGLLPGHQVYSKRARQSTSQAPTILLAGNIAKQGSSSANVAGSPLVDQLGEDSPRAGRRATWLPRATQDQATTSPSAISTCGRRTIASSGQVGFLLRAAIGIGRIASFWDSLNSEQVARGSSLTLTAHNLTLYGAPPPPYGGEIMLLACCLCSFRAKEGNPRLLWAYDCPRHTPPPERLVGVWTPWFNLLLMGLVAQMST